MDSDGKLFKKDEVKPKSALYAEYERLNRDGFTDLTRFKATDLDWLQHIHDKHLEFFKEERRMHFGAFMLVGLSLILLLPALLTLEEYFLPLAAIEALLMILLVPYTFVYRKYEEGVRKKMRESVLLENARRLKTETTSTAD